jgi:hypothetical protein
MLELAASFKAMVPRDQPIATTVARSHEDRLLQPLSGDRFRERVDHLGPQHAHAVRGW